MVTNQRPVGESGKLNSRGVAVSMPTPPAPLVESGEGMARLARPMATVET